MTKSDVRSDSDSLKSQAQKAPLVVDSDSDFTADMRLDLAKSMPTQKKRTRRARVQPDEEEYEEPKGGARKRNTNRSTGSGVARRRRPTATTDNNPLAKYFGELGLDPPTESDDSQSEPHYDQKAATSEEEKESNHGEEGSAEPEVLSRTLAIVLESREARRRSGAATPSTDPQEPTTHEPEPLSPPRPLKRKWVPRKAKPLSPSKRQRFETSPSTPGTPPKRPTEDESETEPEPEQPPKSSPVSEPAQLATAGDEDESLTEPEPEYVPPPAPPAPQATAGDSSETVPESDPEPAPRTVPAQAKAPQADDDESVTEPESVVEDEQSDSDGGASNDSDDEDGQWGQRPAFQLKPGQVQLGPHVLAKAHVHVPSAIADGVGADKNDHLERKPRVIQIPASVNTFLREYQREGVVKMFSWYAEGRGGCLGDDMGLGKTVQIATFLGAIMRKTGTRHDISRRHRYVSKLQDEVLRRRSKGQMVRDWEKELPRADARWPTALVVVPSSLIGNWERELETWGYFEVGTYTSSVKPEMRENVLRDFRIGRFDVLLTTHEMARDQIDRFDSLAISVIFVDEAHKVKDPTRKITKAFNRFSCLRRFAVTGTAIQNNFDELWALLDWTNPGALGTLKQWQRYVSHPLTRGQSRSASEDEKLRTIAVSQILKEQFLPRFFLRRTKDLLKDQLPKKTDEVVFCPLTPMQTEVYRRVISTDRVQNMVRKDEICDCGSRKKRGQCCHKFDKADLFRFMSALIKISNHLALILPSPTDSGEQLARNRELSEMVFGKDIPSYGPSMLVPQYCGKWLVLKTLLKEWRKDPSNKILIFTKSVKLLEMLEFHLRSKNVGFVKLEGSTKQTDRMPLIDHFHEDPDISVFLISTLAGGTGLNLTGANKVVIFDPNWNPAHDLQAMDRAYRIGQKRDVSVYRLLGAGSLEELIYARQVYKQQQMAVGYDASLQTRYFEGVQGDKTRQGELFGIKNIFSLAEGEVRTKMAIEKATLMDLDWALANMEAKAKQPASKRKEGWVYEAELKVKKEDGDLHGLGALLLDDDAPPIDDGEDAISKTLKDVGVTYTHRNENLIVNNRIEGEKIKALMEGKKKARRQARATKAAPRGTKKQGKEKEPAKQDDDWPPKKGTRKPPTDPKSRLRLRRAALVGLGMISEWDRVDKFAEVFLKMSQEEQEDVIRRLDDYAREQNAATASRSRY